MRITRRDILFALVIGATAIFVGRLMPPQVLKAVIVAYLAAAATTMFLCGMKWGRSGIMRGVNTVIFCLIAPMYMLDYVPVSFVWSLVWTCAIALVPMAGLALGTRFAKTDG